MKPTEGKPNIILIVCDQMRGDCLGIAGHPDVKTPYLDTLAAEGVRFENAYSACPSCIPARAALLTGMSQKRHGRVGYQDGIAWDYPDMLPQVLSDNGYHTEAVGKMHVHPPLRRCGFNNLSLHDGYLDYYRKPETPAREHQLAHDAYLKWLKRREGHDADITDSGIECNSWLTHPWIYEETSHPTYWTVSEGIEFLEKRDPDVPFFLMLSFVRPHPPWDAPASYFDLYKDKDLRPPVTGDWDEPEKTEAYGRIYDSRFGSADPELRHLGLAGYYACITHMDHQIGRFIKALAQEQILEDSIILFVSDHGEMLFDHSLFRKVVPYQGSVHIPLIVRPGRNAHRSDEHAKTNKAVVELRDIAPTILDYAGIEAPATMDGKSLRVCVEEGDDSLRPYLHGEHSGGEISNHYIVTEQDKFIWFSSSGQEQYFDLQNDPQEQEDLIRSPGVQDRIRILRNHLIDELAEREEGYTDGKELIPGRPSLTVLTRTETDH